MPLLLLVILFYLCVSSSLTIADEIDNDSEYNEIGKSLIAHGKVLHEAADSAKKQREKINVELELLKALVEEKSISLEEAVKSAELLEKKIELGIDKQDEIDLKYKEIDENFKKYVFQTKSQAIVPFFYAALAIGVSDGDYSEKALHGLAGYGTGALIENTRFGISKGITWLKFETDF